VQTPRFCGLCSSAGTLLREICARRGRVTSWLIVGISLANLIPNENETTAREGAYRTAVTAENPTP
jgi:hypothetical protein